MATYLFNMVGPDRMADYVSLALMGFAAFLVVRAVLRIRKKRDRFRDMGL